MNNSFDLSLLQKLTEDPEIMSKAISMASMLAGTDIFRNLNPGGPSGGPDRFEGTLNKIEDQPSPDPERPSGMPPGLPGRSADNIPSPGKRIPGTHEQRIKLLEAMRPFVPEDRRPKIDFIIKLLGLLHVANELGLKNIL